MRKLIVLWWPALQYFEHVEEAEWAVQVLKASGKPWLPTCASDPRETCTASPQESVP